MTKQCQCRVWSLARRVHWHWQRRKVLPSAIPPYRMMSSRILANSFLALRRHIPSSSSLKQAAGSAISFRLASSVQPGAGNPKIIEDLPSTSDEVKVSPELSKKANEKAPSPSSSLPEAPQNYNGVGTRNDWSRSYFGLSTKPFSKEIADILQTPLDPLDIEMKPGTFSSHSELLGTKYCIADGLIYLPEIKYRRILNKAFGPGGWGLAPRSETNVGPKVVSREYALVCLGR